jgi:hypothetical protein
MVLADFHVQTTYAEAPREVRVVVYDSLKGLRIAASRHDRTGRTAAFADTLGICHRFEWSNPAGESQPLCAIVRLAQPHLGGGLVSHELAHAAVWMRDLHADDEPLTTANDEDFCWTLGDLVRQTFNALLEHEVYN